jgi:FKBP-type peptidyl-prolyl cis-trans isomerase SlyD
LTDDTGTELDSSSERDPITYIHGTGIIIPGLEQALEGQVVGASLNVSIAPEDGYDVVDPQMIEEVPRDSFRDVDTIEVGIQFEAQTEKGDTVAVAVDGNHPLAGKTLNFDVSIEDVRDATEEELEHGHVQGPGKV